MIDPAYDEPGEMTLIPYEVASVGAVWPNESGDPLLDPNTFDAFRDRAFLLAARQKLMATNDRNGVLVLDHVARLCRERRIEAAQRFVAGDIDGTVAIWNKYPEHGSVRSIEKIAEGTYLMTTSRDLKYTLNQDEKLAWLRSLHVFLLKATPGSATLN
jgi:hypothetical protein